MPRFFKKRRRAKTENKNQEKIRRAMAQEHRAQAEGVLGQRFSFVQKLTVQLDFRNPQGHQLHQETRTFGPADLCHFDAPCPGACGTGSFNLAAKVENVLNSRQSTAEARGRCQDPLFGGAGGDVCGCELVCRLNAVYSAA